MAHPVARSGVLLLMATEASKERVPGYPGLWRRNSEAPWRLSCQRNGRSVNLNMRTRHQETAQELYREWEKDPIRFEQDWDQRERREIRFGAACEEFLDEKQMQVEERRYRHYRNMCNQLLEAIGASVPCGRVTEEDWTRQAESVTGLTNYRATQLATLKAFGRWLLKKGYVRRNLVAFKVPKPEKSKRSRLVRPEEVRAVLRELKRKSETSYHQVVVMYALGLAPCDANKIRPEYLRMPARELVGPRAKTAVKYRVPIVDDEVLASVLWLGGWVAEVGRYPPRITDHEWAQAIKRAGVEHFMQKDLRDTRITIWVNDDQCWLHDVKQWAGHASVTQTEEYLIAGLKAKRLPAPCGIGGKL